MELHPDIFMNAETEFTLAPDVIVVPVRDGSARLLDMGGQFYAIDATGAAMLREALGQGVEAAAAWVANQYQVDRATAQGDIEAFLADLQQRGLVRRRQASQPRRGGRVAFPLMASALRFVIQTAEAPTKRAWILLGIVNLFLRFFGWAQTVDALKRTLPNDIGPRSAVDAEQTGAAIDVTVRKAAAEHFLKMECKERALCCWVMSRLAGLDTALVVGIQLFPLAGHCWCELGARILSDDRARCQQFEPVVRYN